MLQHNFQAEALMPYEALDSCGDSAVTKDGVKVTIRYCGLYDNREGLCRERLEQLCKEIYNVPFRVVEVKWKSIRRIDGCWMWIKMEKAEEKAIQTTESHRKNVSLQKRR